MHGCVRNAVVVGCCLALVMGCASRRLAPAVPASSDAGLVVTLAWAAAVDLDLYVTMPGGETVYYANPREAFVRDARCDDGGGGARSEQVGWRNPAAGRYRIGVDFPEGCEGGAREASYRLVVDLGGRRTERIGTARLLVREPWVADVEVP